MKHVRIWLGGVVQGVGFRWWIEREATRLGLTGEVENLFDGRVEIDVQGPEDDVNTFIERLTGQPGPPGRPGQVKNHLVQAEPVNDKLVTFRIL